MKVNLQGRHIVTFGVKDAGKSFHVNETLQKAAESGKRIVIFDPNDEYDDHENILRIIPTVTRGDEAIEQLDETLHKIEDQKDDIDYFVVDEISRFHVKGGQLDGPLGEMIDLNAHWDMGIWFIARRPTQVHTDIREMADYIFLFLLRGSNDLGGLDDISEGLENTMREMMGEYPPHSYIIVGPNRSYGINRPL